MKTRFVLFSLIDGVNGFGDQEVLQGPRSVCRHPIWLQLTAEKTSLVLAVMQQKTLQKLTDLATIDAHTRVYLTYSYTSMGTQGCPGYPRGYPEEFLGS